ncbi:MAG: DUF2797 domain-containing protein [Enterobacter cloacae]|nr:DUF2797 domain-containing protein [Enterobacter cloacae]
MSKYIFSGIHYNNNDAFLLLDSGSKCNCDRTVLPLRNKKITITRHRGRYCTGYYDIATLQKHPCPLVSTVENNEFHCLLCARKMDFKPHFYNIKREGVSSKQRSYLDEKHFVYLAFFGEGYVKVGITNKRRKYTRLFEQGARFACMVAECSSAYEARTIEHNFITLCGLKEVVRKSTKRKLALINYHKEMAEALFNEKISSYNAMTHYRENLKMIDFKDMDSESFFSGHFPLELINDVSDISPIHISGQVLGTIGDLLFIDTGALVDLIDTNFIKAHIVSLEMVDK